MADIDPAAPPSYPPPPLQPRRTHTWVWVIGGAVFVFLILFIGLLTIGMLAMRHGDQDAVEGSGAGGRVGVIELEGVILSTQDFEDNVKRYFDDDSVKAIIIRINSPGGGAAASQEIYSEIRHLKQEHKKPIVSSIETVGASGAYYVASATDKIYANNASVVGSIGVIAEWVNYGDLMKWAKLKSQVLTAGALKDAGDPARDMTPQERAYLQSIVDDLYGQFVRDVAVGRHTTPEAIKPLATGQVWTGEQAVPLKLIDGIGTFREVVEKTGQQVGLGKNPTLMHPAKHKRSIFDLLFGDASDLLPDAARNMRTQLGFYYLWGR